MSTCKPVQSLHELLLHFVAKWFKVFATTLEPMIKDVMKGFEATVFAYGQTGTGKTYTMEGDTKSEEHQGVIPRAIRAIFEKLQAYDYVQSSVKVTYLEVRERSHWDTKIRWRRRRRRRKRPVTRALPG